MHQNRGKSTNCKKTSPVAPRIGIHSQSVRDQSAVHPKPRQCRHNLLQSWELWQNCIFQAIQSHPRFKPPQRPTDCNRPNQHNQTGSQLDCRTTKDCNAIDRIALRLQQLHATQGDQDQQSIEDRAQDHNVQATRGNSRSRDTTRFMSQSRNPHAIDRNRRTGPPESIEQAGALGGLVIPLPGDCGAFWHKILQPWGPW